MGITAERRNAKKWKNLFLLRHGESTCNEVNRFAGTIDAPLTALGEAQAVRAASQWPGRPPNVVYVSPLLRARRTAELLCASVYAKQGEIPTFRVDHRLRERHFGDFTLRNKAFIQRDVGLRSYEQALYGDVEPLPDGEAFSDFSDRILGFLRDEIHPLLVQGKRVLVVTHKYVIELLSRLVLRLKAEDGYDIRLPNARVLNAASLRAYLRHESRRCNYSREWIVLNHAFVLLAGVLIGITLRFLDLVPAVSPIVGFGLLSMATVISLARVALLNVNLTFADGVISARRVLVRYAVLPLAVGLLAQVGVGEFLGIRDAWIFSLAILLAAPSAITALTVSRTSGGVVLPTVYIILLSTATSTAIVFPLLQLYLMEGAAGLVALLIGLSALGLLGPMAVVNFLRVRFPIETATLAERNAAPAVLLLTLFVILSFQSINLDTFLPHGVVAILLGLVMRLSALLLVRRNSLYSIDDYVSMSYPNIFLVILLASLLEVDELLHVSTWFLAPMFALAPVDEWLCRRIDLSRHDVRLLSFLKVERTAFEEED